MHKARACIGKAMNLVMVAPQADAHLRSYPKEMIESDRCASTMREICPRIRTLLYTM